MNSNPPDSVIGKDALIFLSGMACVTPPEGCFVEVGVYKGGSAWYLAQVAAWQGRPLYLYDTFEGIPYKADIDKHEVGDFGDTSAAAVRAAIPMATVVQGVFPRSMLDMPRCAFAHVDVDQYQAVKDCCEALADLMLPGGIMLFDDYGCLPGATKAVDDLGWRLGHTPHGKAFVRF